MDAINALGVEMQRYSDMQLREKTQEFKDKLRDGAQLEDILVEAFAVWSLQDRLLRWNKAMHVGCA